MAKPNQTMVRAPAPAVVPTPVRLAVAPPPAPIVAAPKARFYRVLKETHVPRQGAHYVLPAGKVISSSGYDIEHLQRLGVPLEEVPSGENQAKARVVG